VVPAVRAVSNTADTVSRDVPPLRVIVMALGAGEARAATITFNANGVFTNGATLTGTLTIDNVAGLVTGAAINVGLPTPTTQNTIDNQRSTGANRYQVDLYEGAILSFPQLALSIVDPGGTLVGYTNGGRVAAALYLASFKTRRCSCRRPVR
jgi:hypothetical protein